MLDYSYIRVCRDGKNKVDFTYIENVVEGHMKAAEVVKPGSKTSGKVNLFAFSELEYFACV